MGLAVKKAYQLVGKEQVNKSVVKVGAAAFGGRELPVIAGPCAVESREQLQQCAEAIVAAGGKMMRGGTFKPRTSPYAFQGMEKKGLELLAEVREKLPLAVVTEIIDEYSLDAARDLVDMVQIGSRNMQNFNLLKLVGKSGKPVILKRGLSSTIEEWLLAAEYIMAEGNDQVVLCERGIRTYETATRNTLDLSAVSLVKQLSHLPVIADPSHATGLRNLITPMARAAIAAGADGLLIEVHPEPEKALCDGAQSLTLPQYRDMLNDLKPLATALGYSM
ncbi:MAG TPA: 3-deoxy-7-phosphoheptulonate synthase [Bacillota bacterium]|nr:3-deoxy-7-phosphoheptulonate synthase [Bacillota bacterium]